MALESIDGGGKGISGGEILRQIT